MEIAPGIQATSWLNLDLEQSPDSPSWATARDIFRRRIAGRYLDPVAVLVAAESDMPALRRRFGFAVLAIDCLLVETLQAFRWGVRHTKYRSREAFQTFLTERPGFSPHFDSKAANQFYDDYRCGILHQAEVAGASLVWTVGDLVQRNRAGLIVNRTMFHDTLVAEIELYIEALKAVGEETLRANFRAKMDYIAAASA